MTSARAQRNLDALETMPRGLRECVQEFGSQIVNEITQCGITNPQTIRRVVHTCWMGARQPNQRVGGTEKGNHQSPVADQLDWLLIQAGSPVSAATILRVLWLNNMVIVPREPSTAMIDASMAAVTLSDPVATKREKHRRRVRTAIEAGARRLWPHLFREADEKSAMRVAVEQEISGAGFATLGDALRGKGLSA